MKRTKENVQSLINEGKSVREIAEVFGITYTPMRMWMKKNGLSTNYYENRKKWEDADLKAAIESSVTKAEAIRKIGLQVRPGNYETINKYIERLDIDTSHMVGKSHGSSVDSRQRSLEEVLVENSDYSRSSLKRKLLKNGLLENKCSQCGLEEWNEKPLVMILDHINGINNDNRLNNLRMLCPNCNSQTDTFCRGSGASQVIASV